MPIAIAAVAMLMVAGGALALLVTSRGADSPDRVTAGLAASPSISTPPTLPRVTEQAGDEGHLLTISVDPERLIGRSRSLPDLSVVLTNETGRDLEVRGCLPGGGVGWAIPLVAGDEPDASTGSDPSTVDDGPTSGPPVAGDGVVSILAMDVDCDPSVTTWPAGRAETMDLPLRPLEGSLEKGRHRARVELEQLDGPILVDVMIE